MAAAWSRLNRSATRLAAVLAQPGPAGRVIQQAAQDRRQPRRARAAVSRRREPMPPQPCARNIGAESGVSSFPEAVYALHHERLAERHPAQRGTAHAEDDVGGRIGRPRVDISPVRTTTRRSARAFAWPRPPPRPRRGPAPSPTSTSCTGVPEAASSRPPSHAESMPSSFSSGTSRQTTASSGTSGSRPQLGAERPGVGTRARWRARPPAARAAGPGGGPPTPRGAAVLRCRRSAAACAAGTGRRSPDMTVHTTGTPSRSRGPRIASTPGGHS